MKSLRRVVSLALASARDLFAGHGGALLLLALLAATVATLSARGRDDLELRAVLLRERTDGAALVALFAVMLAAAHEVSDDRRERRLRQWLTTPLRPFEYLLAKWLGVAVGLGLPLVLLHVALVALPEAGLLRHPEQFAPRAFVPVTEVVMVRGDGRALTGGLVAVIASGDQLVWKFAAPPAPPAGFELELALRRLGDGNGEDESPAIALELDGRPWIERRELRAFAETRLLERLPADARPRTIALRLSGAGAQARIDTASCRLLGEQGSVGPSLLRAASGVALLLLFGGAFAASLAVVLPDVLALALSSLVVALGFLRPLLLEVAASVADDRLHASLATREFASLLGSVVTVVPDLAALVASGRFATAATPFARGDLQVHGAPLAFALVALFGAAILLRRGRRGRRWTVRGKGRWTIRGDA